MKLKHIVEARLAHKWKPKTLTQQWIDLADPEKVKDQWSKQRMKEYQNYVQWIIRHEDQLNEIYQYFAGGWEDFVKETEPPRREFDRERDEWEYEWEWDQTGFKPHDQISDTVAYKELRAADDFDDDWFEEVRDLMSYTIMQG